MTAANSVVGPAWGWADRLRKIRRTVACVSQADMAALLGVKPATYSAWEGGRHEPPMRVAFDVARRLEQHFPGRITAAWVLGLDSDKGLLPRMDSNHQPPDYRRGTGQPLFCKSDHWPPEPRLVHADATGIPPDSDEGKTVSLRVVEYQGNPCMDLKTLSPTFDLRAGGPIRATDRGDRRG